MLRSSAATAIKNINNPSPSPKPNPAPLMKVHKPHKLPYEKRAKEQPDTSPDKSHIL